MLTSRLGCACVLCAEAIKALRAPYITPHGMEPGPQCNLHRAETALRQASTLLAARQQAGASAEDMEGTVALVELMHKTVVRGQQELEAVRLPSSAGCCGAAEAGGWGRRRAGAAAAPGQPRVEAGGCGAAASCSHCTGAVCWCRSRRRRRGTSPRTPQMPSVATTAAGAQATIAGVATSGDVGESCCCLWVVCLHAAAWGWFAISSRNGTLGRSTAPAASSCTISPT